jgi:hypothetical protein
MVLASPKADSCKLLEGWQSCVESKREWAQRQADLAGDHGWEEQVMVAVFGSIQHYFSVLPHWMPNHETLQPSFGAWKQLYLLNRNQGYFSPGSNSRLNSTQSSTKGILNE